MKAFEDSNNKEKVLQEEIDRLHRVIGRQTAEIDFLAKVLSVRHRHPQKDA